MSDRTVSFWCLGEPATKGSTRSFPHATTGRMVTLPAAKNLRSWEAYVRAQATQHWEGPPTREPVELCLRFLFIRPKSHLTSKGEPKKGSPKRPGIKDIDKLCRAMLDAFQGVVYVNDKQVSDVTMQKRYGDCCGVCVEIRTEENNE